MNWYRDHLGGQAVAFAAQAKREWRASVIELPGERRVSRGVVCPSEEAAKSKAEELLLAAYPHDCGQQACAPWRHLAGGEGTPGGTSPVRS